MVCKKPAIEEEKTYNWGKPLKGGEGEGVIDLQLVGKKPESNGGKAIQ